MRILICGGREFDDYDYMESVLDQYLIYKDEPLVLAHGDCRGADKLSQRWAHSRDINCIAYPPDWGTNGYLAGPMRRPRTERCSFASFRRSARVRAKRVRRVIH